jgi:hypothetical protein
MDLPNLVWSDEINETDNFSNPSIAITMFNFIKYTENFEIISTS